jgi:1-phosphofructokinase
MIVTVTPNPSIDRTVSLPSPLVRGAVHRVSSVTSEPGGKGVNVARTLTLAGLEAVALLPAPPNDPLVTALQASAVPFRCIPISGAVRTNLTITEADGTTTKLNEPGAPLDASALDTLTRVIIAAAERARWVVMSGSLPPGVPDHWYADVVAELAPLACKVAVDTSERPLAALAASFHRAAPDLIKPNAEELAGLTGVSAQTLEAAATQGDPEPILTAACRLIDQGARAVLATLGAAGAILVDESGSWMATSAPITPRSTVGAGDASLAGYVRAEAGGAEPPQRLRMAVAYGSAAAALPGSALPAPAQVDLNAVGVTTISPTPATS